MSCSRPRFLSICTMFIFIYWKMFLFSSLKSWRAKQIEFLFPSTSLLAGTGCFSGFLYSYCLSMHFSPMTGSALLNANILPFFKVIHKFFSRHVLSWKLNWILEELVSSRFSYIRVLILGVWHYLIFFLIFFFDSDKIFWILKIVKM